MPKHLPELPSRTASPTVTQPPSSSFYQEAKLSHQQAPPLPGDKDTRFQSGFFIQARGQAASAHTGPVQKLQAAFVPQIMAPRNHTEWEQTPSYRPAGEAVVFTNWPWNFTH